MILQRYTSPMVIEFYHHKFRHTHTGYQTGLILDLRYEYPSSSIESVGEASGASPNYTGIVRMCRYPACLTKEVSITKERSDYHLLRIVAWRIW